jgi:NitT/TauT family transport system substrate-binding protein
VRNKKREGRREKAEKIIKDGSTEGLFTVLGGRMEAIRMRGVLSLLALILVFGLLAAGCTPKKAKEKTPIKIGINVWPGIAHAYLAQEKGFFRKNAVEVELVFRKEYSKTIEDYNNGRVHGNFEVFVDAILQDAGGIDSKVVYVPDYSETGDVIMGKPELNSLLDLKGRKVSIEGINSFSHLFVLTALEKAGLKEAQIQFEIVPAQQVLKALEEGRIDAGHTWEPTKSAAIKKGFRIIAQAKDIPGMITDVLVFKAKVAKERPGEIKAIVKSLLEARDFLYAHKEEAIKIMAKNMDMSEAEMREGISGVYHPDLKENLRAMQKSDETSSLFGSGKKISDFYLNRGQLSCLPDLDKIIEPRFVEELAK